MTQKPTYEELQQRIKELETSEFKSKKRKELLDKLFNLSLDMLCVAEINGHFKVINDAFEKTLGYSKEELCAHPYIYFIHPDDQTSTICKGDQLSHGKPVVYFENRFRCKNGSFKWLSWTSMPIPEENRTYAVARDITNHKQAEEDLKKAHEELEQRIEERTAELKQIKDHLDNIIESSLDCIIVSDNKGCITRVNKSLLKLTGYEKEEVVGKLTMELSITKEGTYETTTGEMVEIGRDYFNSAKGTVEKLFKEGGITNWESYFLCKDKRIVPVEVNTALLYNEKGEVIGSIGINRDVTERKQAEKEIKEAKEFLENIFRTSVDGIMVTDHEGSITMVNEAIERMLGYTKNELIGKRTIVLNPKGKRYEKCANNYLTKLFEEGTVSAFDINYLKKDGNLIDAEVNTALLKDGKGNILGAVAIIRDITERKQFEKILKLSEEKYRSLIENANDAIISTNKDGEIIGFNKKAEEILGYTYKEIVGKPVTLITDPSTGKQQRKKIDNLKKIRGGGVIKKTVESIAVRKDGKKIPVEGSLCAVKVGGEHILTSIIRDISERKEMEDKFLQSEKLKSLGELAGGVAHDFNNVLAAILGRAQLLKMVVDPPPGKEERRNSVIELKEGLEIIEKASKDGSETVRRIQEFARIRDDDKHFTTVDLNEIIDCALEFTRMKWKDDVESKGIKIKIQKEFSTLPTTSGKASELREVFTNLINNAVDAMPQGGTIKIKTFKEDSQIAVCVEDTGVGIPKSLRSSVFDPFFTTKGVRSTGLGMSVSYGIIKRHRGDISIDSIEGRGTAFTVKLPIFKKITKEEKANHRGDKPRKAKLLVIEDEEEVRNLLFAILKKSGHEVEVVSDGSQGIEMFNNKDFDLVFTDLGMPGMSGWQVAEEIKGTNGRVPVILITGWDIELKEQEIKDKWVDFLIHKPFEKDQVLHVVQEGMILRDRFKEA